MVSSLRRRWGAQPQVGARLRAELPGPALYFLEEAGPINLANGVWPTTSGGVRVGTPAGLARATAGSSYPIWATQPSFQSAKKSAVVYLIPRQGTPPSGSRRVISDFNGTTYSFVITFDAGVIGLFCHNGTTGGAATWSTTVTVGQPMCIVGVADGTTIYLYVDGQLRASAALSGSLRAVTDGVAIGGNPAGAFPDILDADFLFALQLPYAIAAPMAREISLDPALVFAPRRIWVPVSAGGGDVTLALSGEGSTASAGTLANSRTVAASGQAATASAGTVAPSVTIALSGQSVTASSGTVTQSKAAALSGQAVTASAGTLAPSASIALSGQAATASAGTVTYTADGNVTLALSGQAVAASAGTVAPAATVATSGQAATVSAGTAVAGRSIAASGTQITTAAGTLTLGIVVPLSGQAAAAGAGTVTYSTAGAVVVALTGQAVEANAGTMSYAEQILSAAPIGHGPGMSRRSPSKGGSRAPQLSTRTR